MTFDAGSLVLLVDDNVDALETWAHLLAAAGLRVEIAVDGEQAFEKARSVVPDAIVMDLSMPGRDGLDVTRRLKADAVVRGIPVIACIANVLAEVREAAQQAGCESSLAKPVNPTLLVAEINRVVGLARQAKATGPGTPCAE